MADRPNVSVKRVGAKYEISYQMYSPNGKSPSASATGGSALEFNAKVGSQHYHDVSQPIPGGISIIKQETKGDTHVVTVNCSSDPTKYFQ